MMARSTTRSNQRPDTLMQDRICQIDETSCNARPDHTYIRGQSRRLDRPAITSGLPGKQTPGGGPLRTFGTAAVHLACYRWVDQSDGALARTGNAWLRLSHPLNFNL